MKKIFSILIVAVAVMAISCGTPNKEAEQTEATEIVTIEENVADTTACCADTTCCVEGQACTTEGCTGTVCKK